MSAVALDVIPELGRPAAVEKVVAEAVELRDRFRVASEELASAQQALEQAEKSDIESAAERIRSGQAPGGLSQTIAKTRRVVEAKTRDAAALELAAKAAAEDVARLIREHASDWLEALDAQKQESRESALRALDAFEQSTAELRAAASTATWLRDGVWGQPPRAVVVGSQAESSRRITANSSPLDLPTLLGFVREAIDEPEPPAPQTPTPVEPLDDVERTNVR